MKNKNMIRRLMSVITGFAAALTVCCFFPGNTTLADSEDTLPFSVYTEDEGMDNPFDRQDDMEVPYDRSRWIQPAGWNVPRIDPKDYEGGIMLYFDKIGLEPEQAGGKVQRFYFSITGATVPVSQIKFHLFYDTRLTVKPNSNGEYINPGKAVSDITTGSAMIKEGQLVFYAYSPKDIVLDRGSIFTVDFIIPEDAGPGELYPIGLAYVDDGIVADTFIDSDQSSESRLQMTYVFTKGIYNGYIWMKGEKPTTTATTTTTAPEPWIREFMEGDVNGDGLINAVDASSVLVYYASVSAGEDGGYSEEQELAADVNDDGIINAVDASCILAYYAYVSSSDEELIPIYEFIIRQNELTE